MDPKEVVDFTYKYIPDPGLRRLIFGVSTIDFEDDIKGNPIACIYRILSLAWLFSFVVWKNDLLLKKKDLPDCDDNIEVNANTLRIKRSFSSVYDSESIGLDLILFTLTEMQLAAINGCSTYTDIFNVREKEFTVNQLRQLIQVWKHSLKHAETNLDTLMQYYQFVIRLFKPLLRNLKIVLDGENVSFEYDDERIYDSFGIVKYKPRKAPYFYYLGNYEIRGTKINLEYSDFIGSKIIEEETGREDFFKYFKLAIAGEKVSAILAQKLYSVDYKYIHNLSLAIADIISGSTKKRLYDAYVTNSPDAFKLLGLDEKPINEEDLYSNNSNWDNIIAILMLELGPSAILEKVIGFDDKAFRDLANNLQVRFWGKINAQDLLNQKDARAKEESELIKKIGNDSKFQGVLIDNATKNVMVQTIIRAVTALYENQQGHEYNAAYVESMNMRIKNIERMIIKGDSSYVDVILALNKALEKSFHFTIAFYYGLIAYAETHIEMETSPVFATLTHAEMIKDCEVAFLKTAGEKAYQCKRYAVGESINAFRILANKFSSSTENKERSISKTGNLLKSVIGRNYLCDVKMFNKLSDPVAAIINDAKHWNAGDGSQVALKAAENIDKVKDLLDFFIYNNDYLVEKRKKQLVSVDPIYPYVVRYCAKSENRDRYNIYNYVVNMSGDDMDMDVKLLTEKSCEINELYYCIPNMNGTLPKWWIKPFLIKCRDFDKLFLEPEKGDK